MEEGTQGGNQAIEKKNQSDTNSITRSPLPIFKSLAIRNRRRWHYRVNQVFIQTRWASQPTERAVKGRRFGALRFLDEVNDER